MMVREAMRPVLAIDESGTLDDVIEAMATSGSEVIPIVGQLAGSVAVVQMVHVRDVPKLRKLSASAAKGHAVGETALELLAALGRRAGRFPTVGPDATLADAWGAMADASTTHLAVVNGEAVLGLLSLSVSWNEFPYRSATAGFLR